MSGELITREPEGGAAAKQADESSAVSFINMIERASRDPAVDIDKMERLMQMHERMIARQAETDYYAALAAMQTELPILPERGTIKNKSGGTQSKYVLWEDLNEIIKPILSRHGFAISFLPGNEGAKITVTGILSHAGGHSVRSTMVIPLDESGAKNGVQGLGSSTSYGKRYVASAMLNLTSRGEDNDGQGSGGPKRMPDKVRADWLAAIDALDDLAASDALWQLVATACNEVGDIPAYDELKSAMAKRRRTLRGDK